MAPKLALRWARKWIQLAVTPTTVPWRPAGPAHLTQNPLAGSAGTPQLQCDPIAGTLHLPRSRPAGPAETPQLQR